MPYKIRRVNTRKNCYSLMNTDNRRVFSQCTTRSKAKRQMRLLNAIRYNPTFIPYGSKKKGKNFRRFVKTVKKNQMSRHKPKHNIR